MMKSHLGHFYRLARVLTSRDKQGSQSKEGEEKPGMREKDVELVGKC